MNKKIEAYNLVDFVKKVVEGVKEGYQLNYDDNDTVPRGSIGFYTATLVKKDKVAALLKPKEPVQQEIEQTPTLEVSEPEIPLKEFTPSVVFVAEQPQPKAKKPGRPAVVRKL
jgi:hypothetical protein